MMQDAGDNGFPIKTFGNDEKEIPLFLRGKRKDKSEILPRFVSVSRFSLDSIG